MSTLFKWFFGWLFPKRETVAPVQVDKETHQKREQLLISILNYLMTHGTLSDDAIRELTHQVTALSGERLDAASKAVTKLVFVGNITNDRLNVIRKILEQP